MKYDNNWFLKRIKEKRPHDYNEYNFLEEYVDAKTYLRAIHIPCGQEVPILPNTFISRGSGCKDCATSRRAKKQAKSHEDVVALFPEGVVALSTYKSTFEPMEVYCEKCDSSYPVVARELIKSGCTRCTRTYKRSLADVVAEVHKDSEGEYKVLSTSYVNAHTHIEMLHTVCNRTYPVTVHNFRRGKRCPHCNESKGEVLVSKILTDDGFEFTPQARFEGLVSQRHLSYDFFVPSINTLIEYQGEQHYKPVDIFGGEEQLKIQQRRDNLKRAFAKENGMTLIEIPYTCATYKEVHQLLKNHPPYQEGCKARGLTPNSKTKI